MKTRLICPIRPDVIHYLIGDFLFPRKVVDLLLEDINSRYIPVAWDVEGYGFIDGKSHAGMVHGARLTNCGISCEVTINGYPRSSFLQDYLKKGYKPWLGYSISGTAEAFEMRKRRRICRVTMDHTPRFNHFYLIPEKEGLPDDAYFGLPPHNKDYE